MNMRRPVRVNLAGQVPLLTLVVLCAITALLTNRFLSPFNLTNILVQSSIMAVIAMGMTFVIVISRCQTARADPPRMAAGQRLRAALLFIFAFFARHASSSSEDWALLSQLHAV